MVDITDEVVDAAFDAAKGSRQVRLRASDIRALLTAAAPHIRVAVDRDALADVIHAAHCDCEDRRWPEDTSGRIADAVINFLGGGDDD